MRIISVVIISCTGIFLTRNVQSYAYEVLLGRSPYSRPRNFMQIGDDYNYVQNLDYIDSYDTDLYESYYYYDGNDPYNIYNTDPYGIYTLDDYTFDEYSLHPYYPHFRQNQFNFSESVDNELAASGLTSLLEIHCQTAISIRENIVKILTEFLTKTRFNRNEKPVIKVIQNLLDQIYNREVSTVYFNHNLYKLSQSEHKNLGLHLLSLLHSVVPHLYKFSMILNMLVENPRRLRSLTESVNRNIFVDVDERVLQTLETNPIDIILQEIVEDDEAYMPPGYFSMYWFKILLALQKGKVTPTPQLIGCLMMDFPLSTQPEFMRFNYNYTYHLLSSLNDTHHQKKSCDKDSLAESNHTESTNPNANVTDSYEMYYYDTPEYDFEKPLQGMSLQYAREFTKNSNPLSTLAIGDSTKVLPLDYGQSQEVDSHEIDNDSRLKTTLGGASIAKSMSTPKFGLEPEDMSEEEDYNDPSKSQEDNDRNKDSTGEDAASEREYHTGSYPIFKSYVTPYGITDQTTEDDYYSSYYIDGYDPENYYYEESLPVLRFGLPSAEMDVKNNNLPKEKMNRNTAIFRGIMVQLYNTLFGGGVSKEDIKEEHRKLLSYLKGCFIPNIDITDTINRCVVEPKKCFNYLVKWSADNRYCDTSNENYNFLMGYVEEESNNPLHLRPLKKDRINFLEEEVTDGDKEEQEWRDAIKKLFEQIIHEVVKSPNTDYVAPLIKTIMNYLPNNFTEKHPKELNVFFEMLTLASKQKTSQDILSYLKNAVDIFKIDIPILEISHGLHKLIDFDSLSVQRKAQFNSVLNYLIINPQIALKVIKNTETNNENEFVLNLFETLKNEESLPFTIRQKLKNLSDNVRIESVKNCNDK